jgi:hypothetical protein
MPDKTSEVEAIHRRNPRGQVFLIGGHERITFTCGTFAAKPNPSVIVGALSVTGCVSEAEKVDRTTGKDKTIEQVLTQSNVNLMFAKSSEVKVFKELMNNCLDNLTAMLERAESAAKAKKETDHA